MKITIIIPSFNQGNFLEETLDSALSQGYANKEIIVVDGGSTDQSREILMRYDQHLAWWVSEPDRGQSHAINKGLAKMTGEVWSYLNSDDLLSPGALQTVADCFADRSTHWWAGTAERFGVGQEIYHPIIPQPLAPGPFVLSPWQWQDNIVPCSVATFMHRSLSDRVGLMDESLHYCMDHEYYIRVLFREQTTLHITPTVLGRWRFHSSSKTMTDGIAYKFMEEGVRVAEQYADSLSPSDRQAVLRDIVNKKRLTEITKAQHFLTQGERKKGSQLLFGVLRRHPSLFFSRYWQGVFRKALFAADKS